MFNALSICFLGQTHEILKGNYPPQTEAAMETKAFGAPRYQAAQFFIGVSR